MSYFQGVQYNDIDTILHMAEVIISERHVFDEVINNAANQDMVDLFTLLRAWLDFENPGAFGKSRYMQHLKAIREALQGIEDHDKTEISCQTAEDGVHLVVSIGGSVVEIP